MSAHCKAHHASGPKGSTKRHLRYPDPETRRSRLESRRVPEGACRKASQNGTHRVRVHPRTSATASPLPRIADPDASRFGQISDRLALQSCLWNRHYLTQVDTV